MKIKYNNMKHARCKTKQNFIMKVGKEKNTTMVYTYPIIVEQTKGKMKGVNFMYTLLRI